MSNGESLPPMAPESSSIDIKLPKEFLNLTFYYIWKQQKHQFSCCFFERLNEKFEKHIHSLLPTQADRTKISRATAAGQKNKISTGLLIPGVPSPDIRGTRYLSVVVILLPLPKVHRLSIQSVFRY